MNISAEFVRSAARLEDFPRDRLSEVALVGRSNVGKSSLINAALRQRMARTSAAPGKTRLANVYRVRRGRTPPFYLVDLPGYGYARGGRASAAEFVELTQLYFGRAGQVGQVGRVGRVGQVGQVGQVGLVGRGGQVGRVGDFLPDPPGLSGPPDLPDLPDLPDPPGLPAPRARQNSGARLSALLLVDARHPGLESDLEAWAWLQTAVADCGVVATKADKLARGERIRALRELESVLGVTVLPVSAVTGEGLDQLWKLIDRLANSPNPNRPRSSPPGAPRRHRRNP